MNLQMLFDSAVPLHDAINQLLQPLIGPFKATTSPVVGNDAHETETLSTVIHDSRHEVPAVPVDNVAAVIDCYDVLTIESLEAAYQRIGKVKSLRKSDRPGPPGGDIRMTMGIVVARSSEVMLEALSTEMNRLNGQVPSHQWPDAVAVLSTGVISYSAHIPASDRSGDFFLPAGASVTRPPVPSLWVVKVIWPVGNLAFKKIASLVVARLSIYQPGASISDYRELTKEMPSHGAATQTYQFNLANTLVAETREQAIATQLPQDTFNIMSGKAKLGSVQYQEWQDGGVLVVRGSFPIDLFLVFLAEVVRDLPAGGLQYFRSAAVQVSYVLPVSKQQFLQALSIFERRSSNVFVQRETSKILSQKVGDEGSTTPFFARFMIGILGLRDSVYDDQAARERFDALYEPVLAGLRNARETSRDIANEWERHQAKVQSGELVSTSGRIVRIGESIDRQLKRDLEAFLNTTVRTIKQSLQDLARHMGMDFGFLFQKEPAFEIGIASMRTSDPALADYLLAIRQWSEPLLLIRNNLEHGTIPSPKVSYRLDVSPVKAEEPTFDGRPLTEFTNFVLDRVCCFVEEITVSCLRKRLPKGFEITEVPLATRDPRAPERFNTTVTPGGRPPWVLAAHTKAFTEV